MNSPVPQADPRRTTVVAVGIDAYEAGKDWALDGPVSDALRFADWFVERGVPPERITALLSAPPGRAVAEVPYKVLGADRSTVHHTLLRTVAAEESELLWVVWGGHGVLDAEGRRRLFYADATVHDPLNLDFDALLTYYRAAPRHPRQIWLVDACQLLHNPWRSRRQLPREDYGTPMPRTARDQAVLFAARPGEAARNLAGTGTGLFSREALALLREADAGWPPDPGVVMDRLRERFTRLRAEGRAAQTPTYVWSRTWDGDEGQLLSRGGPEPTAPSHADLTADRLRALTDALLAVEEFVEPHGREEILGLLRIGVRAAIPRHSRPRLDTISILRTCARRPGALVELAEALLLCAGGSAEAETAHRLLIGASA
ncbi:effector-associated domain 2-containing protein [Streptomyces sp. NPDC003635]